MDGTAKTFQVIKQRSPEHVTSGNAHVYARTRPSETRRIPESMRAQKINRCVASKLDRTSQGYTNGIRISISMFKKELSGSRLWDAQHAPREARRQRGNGKGPSPDAPAGRDSSARAGARVRPTASLGRPRRRLVWSHPREPPSTERGWVAPRPARRRGPETPPDRAPPRRRGAEGPLLDRVLVSLPHGRHGEHRRQGPSHVRNRGPRGRMSHRQR